MRRANEMNVKDCGEGVNGMNVKDCGEGAWGVNEMNVKDRGEGLCRSMRRKQKVVLVIW